MWVLRRIVTSHAPSLVPPTTRSRLAQALDGAVVPGKLRDQKGKKPRGAEMRDDLHDSSLLQYASVPAGGRLELER